MKFGFFDVIIIFGWLTVTLGAGFWAGLHSNFENYWAGGRRGRLLPLILSVAATQIGAGAIAGIASSTLSSGTGFGLVSLCSTVVGFLLVGKFAPVLKEFGDRYRAYTLAQIFRVRYGRSTQVVAAVVIIIVYMSILAAQFLATSGLITIGTGLDIKLAIVFATVGVVLYSSFAGIPGDIVTDQWHFVGKTVGLFFVLLPALALKYGFVSWLPSVSAENLSPLTFGGGSVLVVGLIASGIVPLLMPELWAKVYASKTRREARTIMYVAAVVVIPFYLLALYLGLLGSTVHYDLRSPDDLIFVQMVDVLPPVLLGIAFATFLSVIISAANSLMLVVSSAILGDLLTRDASSDPKLLESRWITAGAGFAGALIAFSVPDLVRLLLSAFYMLLVLGPALLGLLFWRRATKRAATVSILAGSAVTLAFLYISPKIAFLPGLVVSVVSFIITSLLSDHDSSENADLITELKHAE